MYPRYALCLTITLLGCYANWHDSNLSLGKWIGLTTRFTLRALAHNKTSASSICIPQSMKARHFALSAMMHQTLSELPTAWSPNIKHNQIVKPGFRNTTPVAVAERGPFSSSSWERIESAQSGANGDQGKISLNTGIITRIIQHPSEQFSPVLRNLLQRNDVATLEGNMYQYVRSRGRMLSGRALGANQTTALALVHAALLEKGVKVIPASDMIMKEATNQCHILLREKDSEMGLFPCGGNVPLKGLYSVSCLSQS